MSTRGSQLRRPRSLITALGIACALAAPSFGCGAPEPPQRTAAERTNVVWVLLDALRPDHLSCYGYGRDTSPALDALAKRGARFEDHWSQAPFTLLSVPSYLTGRYEPTLYQDPRHLDIWFLPRPPPEEQLVSSIFRENGYATAMFSASPWYSADSRLARSFESFAPLAHGEGIDPRLRGSNPRLFAWIESHAQAPFFLYIHSLDTHEPRFDSNTDPRWLVPGLPTGRALALRRHWSRIDGPIDERDREQLRGLYDGGIRAADGFVAQIVAAVRELGVEQRTLFVISSDHGEVLAEDGETIGHPASESFDELLRVPLILAGPGVPSGRGVRALTQNVDIVPTLVDLANLETSASFQGVSLRTVLEDEQNGHHTYAYARIQRPLAVFDPDRVLIHPDRKHEVRRGRLSDTGRLQVRAFARPDSVSSRRPVRETEAERESVRAVVREVLQPLRDRVREQPRDVPPVFELGHPTRLKDERVVRDRVDRYDGLWSNAALGSPARIDRAGPFVNERVLAGFPATEDLPVLHLSRRIPNGRYRVSASLRSLTDLSEPVFLRFRAESDREWRAVRIEEVGPRLEMRWIDLGTFDVGDGSFDYAVAAGDRSHAAVLGRLRFEVDSAGGDSAPDEDERQAELERLESLGYLE